MQSARDAPSGMRNRLRAASAATKHLTIPVGAQAFVDLVKSGGPEGVAQGVRALGKLARTDGAHLASIVKLGALTHVATALHTGTPDAKSHALDVVFLAVGHHPAHAQTLLEAGVMAPCVQLLQGGASPATRSQALQVCAPTTCIMGVLVVFFS